MFRRAIIIFFILVLLFIALHGPVQADDPEKPMVQITSPKEGEELHNPVEIGGRCNKYDWELKKVEYHMDNDSGEWPNDWIGIPTIWGISYSLSPGNHTFFIRGWGENGTTDYDMVNFTVLESPPTLSIKDPEPNQEVWGKVGITGTVKDYESDIHWVTLDIGEEFHNRVPVSDNRWETLVDMDQFDPGNITIEVSATDDAGLIGNDSIDVRAIRHYYPRVTILTPEDRDIVSGWVNLTLEVDYPGPSPLWLEVFFIGGPAVFEYISPGLHNYTLQLPSWSHYIDRAFSIKVRVTDVRNHTALDRVTLFSEREVEPETDEPEDQGFKWEWPALEWTPVHSCVSIAAVGCLLIVVFNIVSTIRRKMREKGVGALKATRMLVGPRNKLWYKQVDKVLVFLIVFAIMVSICGTVALFEIEKTNKEMEDEEGPMVSSAWYQNIQIATDRDENIYIFWESDAGTDEYSWGHLDSIHMSKFNRAGNRLVWDNILYPPGVTHGLDGKVTKVYGEPAFLDSWSVWVEPSGNIHLVDPGREGDIEVYYFFDPDGTLLDFHENVTSISLEETLIVDVHGEQRVVQTQGFTHGIDELFELNTHNDIVKSYDIPLKEDWYSHYYEYDIIKVHGSNESGWTQDVFFHEPTGTMTVWYFVGIHSKSVCYKKLSLNGTVLGEKVCSPFLSEYLVGGNRGMHEWRYFVNMDKEGHIHFMVPVDYGIQWNESMGGFYDTDRDNETTGLFYMTSKDMFSTPRVLTWSKKNRHALGVTVSSNGWAHIIFQKGSVEERMMPKDGEIYYKRVNVDDPKNYRPAKVRMTPEDDKAITMPEQQECMIVMAIPLTTIFVVYRKRFKRYT